MTGGVVVDGATGGGVVEHPTNASNDTATKAKPESL
jgi:hypothetical protein